MILVHLLLIVYVSIPARARGQGYYVPAQLPQLKIGGIFDADDTESEIILKQAIAYVNSEESILPNHDLTLVTETLASNNSYYTTICKLLQQGVVGLFGPRLTEAASHTQAVCERYDIPHIETRWDYLTRQDKYTLNFFPHPDILGEAYTNFVNHFNWNRFVILYDSREHLLNLQGLLKNAETVKRRVFLRRLTPDKDGNYRYILKSLQREYDIKNIIIDCELNKALQVLKQAQEIGMIRFDYQYILTTLDLQPVDVEEFKNGDANIWAFQMINPDRPDADMILQALNHLDHQRRESGRGLSTADLLMFDAIHLFAKALQEHIEAVIENIETVTCENEKSWAAGSSIINSMRSMSPFQGLSGNVYFNSSGYRTDIVLQIVGVTDAGLIRRGVWKYAKYFDNRIIMNETEVNVTTTELDLLPLRNRTLTVVTLMTNPFCMHNKSVEVLKGNKQYVGFSIDLLQKLHERLGFDYIIKLGNNGSNDGVVDEVFTKKADLAIGDVTITKERQEKLHFTMPYMNLGISILFSEPQAKAPSLFSFLSPFANEVWGCMIVSFIGVSLILFAVGRFTPYEWENTFPCITEPVALQNQFSLANSFWFTIGSLMQQGSDLAPKSVSTRIIAGTWWFFTLIMVSSYTASLATFLIVPELEYTFSTLQELADQRVIEYGCVVGGSTSTFFSNSTDKTKSKIGKNMQLKTDNAEGIRVILEKPGRFAFFMESTMIEYYMERYCGLEQVGGLLDNKGYGIALQKNSSYLSLFDDQILKLQEEGVLQDLKRKWWKEEGKETCEETNISETVSALGLSHVGGVFVVLVTGCICAVILSFAEFFLRSRRAKVEGESLLRDTLQDLNFALQCRGNVKPVKKNITPTSTAVGTADDLRSLT